MLIVAYDYEGILLIHAVYHGVMINATYYQTSCNTICILYCVLSEYIFCSQAVLCSMTTFRVMWSRQ